MTEKIYRERTKEYEEAFKKYQDSLTQCFGSWTESFKVVNPSQAELDYLDSCEKELSTAHKKWLDLVNKIRQRKT